MSGNDEHIRIAKLLMMIFSSRRNFFNKFVKKSGKFATHTHTHTLTLTLGGTEREEDRKRERENLLGCQAAHNKDPSIGGWHLALGNFNQICSCSCNISTTTTTTTTTLNVCS